MNLPKLFFFLAVSLLGVIAVVAVFKKAKDKSDQELQAAKVMEIELGEQVRSLSGAGEETPTSEIVKPETIKEETRRSDEQLPTANRIEELFRKGDPKLPIVETVVYKSRVDWLQGRPAWISDYASHYKTSRHFIARSLNGKTDYFKQDVAIGDRFNVFRKDKDIAFYLVIDTSRSKMWLYYYDKGLDERVLIKNYDVGLGRVAPQNPSGLLTPLGTYKLGEKVAIYKPKQQGTFNGDKIEMMRVFGTRWIPFEKEIDGATAPAKGFGIHGAPWAVNEKGVFAEDRKCIGKYESDGCVRLASDDVEELFAIVITKPTYAVLVKDFFDAKLPGKEAK
ncbi:L,D-transpeptidase [Estrella lausannensis]|uniref:Putative L,D-transpeptidase n=1 Tax=Estrella lausannensis TaxID=483423 RepID=A0A0H5DPF4_9BACT|nr:L,D-transpeptidase [Estrella lausannensis]CRX38436.1 Putative L,D-transpeptidase [Estrella lausannensis]